MRDPALRAADPGTRRVVLATNVAESSVTLPGIRKIFVVLMIMNVGKILNVSFTQVNVMMNDSVRQSGEIIDTWIYTEGLGKLNYSLSTAVGLLKSVISFMLVFATNRLARKWECAIW